MRSQIQQGCNPAHETTEPGKTGAKPRDDIPDISDDRGRETVFRSINDVPDLCSQNAGNGHESHHVVGINRESAAPDFRRNARYAAMNAKHMNMPNVGKSNLPI